MIMFRNLIKPSMMGISVALLLSSATLVTAAPITMTVVNETQPGISASWIHNASSGASDGFFKNGSKSAFTPMTFDGTWDGTRLTIADATSTGGSIVSNIGGPVEAGDMLAFTGGVLERKPDDSLQGFIQYEITRAGSSLDSGMFFVWSGLAVNQFTETAPNVDLTTWSNNWINGEGKDWTFLETLDSGFAVTYDGTSTTAATFNGSVLARTTDDSQPGSGFTTLGLDLIAVGPPISAETAVPEPGTMLLFGTGVLGLIGYARSRRNRRDV